MELKDWQFNMFIERLDKIIELLELRRSIDQARIELKNSDYSECNCAFHSPGESTAGWHCPVHGHKF